MSKIHRENLLLLFNRANHQPAQNINKKTIKRNKLLLGIITILLPLILILIAINMMVIIKGNHEKKLNPVLEVPGIKKCKLLRAQHRDFVYKQGSIASNMLSMRNIFFIIDDSIMSAKEACAIETALKKFPYRIAYLMQLQCNQSTGPLLKFDYRMILYNYPNAVFIKLEPNEYLSDSPVDGMWNCNNGKKARIAAMAYTAWRFGGSTLTQQILINDRTLLSLRHLKVMVTPEIFISLLPCHGFFYMLMDSLSQNNDDFNINELIDATLLNYNSNYSNPVKNISEKVCSSYLCPLISLGEEVKTKANISRCQLSHLCPEVIKQYHINTASADINDTYFENLT